MVAELLDFYAASTGELRLGRLADPRRGRARPRVPARARETRARRRRDRLRRRALPRAHGRRPPRPGRRRAERGRRRRNRRRRRSSPLLVERLARSGEAAASITARRTSPVAGADVERVALPRRARASRRSGSPTTSGSEDGSRRGAPWFEAWSCLTALAYETTSARIGPLVSPMTFRNPGGARAAGADASRRSPAGGSSSASAPARPSLRPRRRPSVPTWTAEGARRRVRRPGRERLRRDARVRAASHPKHEIRADDRRPGPDDPRPGRAATPTAGTRSAASASRSRRRSTRRERTTRGSTSCAPRPAARVVRSIMLGYHAFVPETPWRSDERVRRGGRPLARRGLRRGRLLLPAGHEHARGLGRRPACSSGRLAQGVSRASPSKPLTWRASRRTTKARPKTPVPRSGSQVGAARGRAVSITILS